MVDAVDSLLNNAVDLYIQAVDYCRISTSQIPTLVGAEIRQIKPESDDVRQMSPDSEDTIPDFGQTVRNLARAAGSPAISSDPGTNPARTPDIRSTGRDPGRPDLAWI
jgi:hypothetical protein